MTPQQQLLQTIRACTHCAACLPLGPRPIVSFSPNTKILLISQAPGSVVHRNGVAWRDQSGKRLREWLGVSDAAFYDPDNFGIVPMGFCYPGKGKSGDLPPRPECAPLWHERVVDMLPEVELKILIGQYAQRAYLAHGSYKTLTENVRHYREFLPACFPLPHPSPRNGIWRRKNEWFEAEVVEELKVVVARVLAG